MAEADPKLADNSATNADIEVAKPQRNWRKLGLMLSLPIALLIGGVIYWQSLQGQVTTDNAYVHLDKVSVSAQVGGPTHKGAAVEEGGEGRQGAVGQGDGRQFKY